MTARRVPGAAGVLALVLVLAVGPAATAQSRRSVSDVLASPSAFDNQEIYVEGVVAASQLSIMTVLGNPPRQDLFPLLLLKDGAASMWVILVASPRVSVGGRPSLFAAPPMGTRILVRGTFRAASRALESYDGFTVR